MFETFAALFFAHVLADFVFQTDKMAATKNRPATLGLHGIIVYLTTAFALGNYGKYVVALAIVHLLIDAIKAAVVKSGSQDIKPYLIDQALHLASIAALAGFAPFLWEDGVWTKTFIEGGLFDFSSWAPEAMILIAGGVYATRAGGFAVGKLMAPFALSAPETSLPKGGSMIGLLERALIYLLFLVGQPAGIGFLIAAKSVLRFDTQNTDKEDKNAKSEYIIIGTLASFSWAIAVSALTLAILNGLNSQPLLEIIPEKP